MTLYFSLAVWISIAFLHTPRPRLRGRLAAKEPRGCTRGRRPLPRHPNCRAAERSHAAAHDMPGVGAFGQHANRSSAIPDQLELHEDPVGALVGGAFRTDRDVAAQAAASGIRASAQREIGVVGFADQYFAR